MNYIKKKHNKNKSNSCSNSVVIQSKTPKKLIENFSIKRNQNYKNILAFLLMMTKKNY